MKRKRGRKAGKKSAPAAPAAAAAEEEAASPEESPSSPSTDAENTPEADQAEDEAPPAAPAAEPAVPEPTPPPPPPSAPPQKPSAPSTHADITYNKPKVGAVYGRVKLKFKSSKPVERPPAQSTSEAKAPAADAGNPGNASVPEVIPEVAADKVTVVTDGQQTEGQAPEMSSSDKEKVMVRKIGAIKIKSAGLPSSSSSPVVVVVVENNTSDRKADAEDESPPSKLENVSENKEAEDAAEPRSSQESEEKQSTPERRRDEKELAAALEAIKKVMKMDAAEPFNVPVDPVALGIPDYFDIIDTPMDFGTICQNLEEGNKYMNSEDVYKDVQFIWDNCTKYNSKGDYIIELMKRVKKGFMKNWQAAGLYSDMPESGGNDNMGDEDAKSQLKSKSKNKRRRPGCVIDAVTRRKKEKDEILAVIDTETTVMDQHNLEGNSGAYNPGSHDTSSSQEQPPQTDMYKEAAEANDSDIQMEDLGKFSGDRPSSLLYPGYEDEGSRQYSDRKEGIEYRDVNSQEEHTPSQPYEYSEVEHHQKAQMESSPEEVEMEDYPVQQENPSFMQLCANLFPSNQSSIFRGRHSLFRRQRRGPLKEGPLHAAIAAIMKQ
ncbi:hypothetical protein PR202_gb29028 [Eleusine coracana subsp. coracana]|uniref:Bromo domain-containing protein n=1 Tax=Eleusine coracana subsp. coracana TaxID=191504 RepID=A0AAV5FYL2_ELECO|nr:hypothetical protein PR202_gb29028 [Eleusine coracana subsp. coracana]